MTTLQIKEEADIAKAILQKIHRSFRSLKEKFSQLGLIEDETGDGTILPVLTSMEEEALLALMSLGYKRQIVARALNRARNNGEFESVEDLIKIALQLI